MIPLMFIQKKENLLTKTTAAITKMEAHYRHLTRAIEVSFAMNLDDNFSLMLELNEFDEPHNIYIKTLRKSAYTKVTPEQPVYTLESDREVVVVDYDTIIEIAHNHVSYEKIKAMDIKAKMLNPAKDPDVKMTEFTYSAEAEVIHMFINNKRFTYTIDNKIMMPVLYEGLTKIEPSRILGNYYIYSIELDGQDYELAIMHIASFKNHYLFKQTEKTHKLSIEKNTLTDKFNVTYTYKDGLIITNKGNKSLQQYFDVVYDEEYKQYLFNAMRDHNLYTEIALAYDLAKHHTFNAYNLTKDLRVMGKVIARAEFSKNTTPEFVLEIQDPLDQFFNKLDYKIEFRFPIYNLVKLVEDTNKNYRTIDYGYFTVDDKLEPISTDIINIEEVDYVTASNSEWFFSVSKYYLRAILENVPVYLIPIIKNLSKGVSLSSLFSLREIDYTKKEVVLNNVFTEQIISFNDIYSNNSMIVSKDQQLLVEDLQQAFGIKFLITPDKIAFNDIGPDKYDEVAMLIKMCEDDDYLLEDIEKDTMHFSRSMTLTISGKVFNIIYNLKRDYIYYLDMSNHTSSPDNTQMAQLNTFSKVVDEVELKRILEFLSLYEYIVKNYGFGVYIDNKLDVIPYVAYRNLLNDNYISGNMNLIVNNINIGYFNRNNQLQASYGASPFTYKEEFAGIYAGRGVTVEKIDLSGNGLTVTYTYDGDTTSTQITISDKGEYNFKDIFEKNKSLPFDKKIFDSSYGPISFNQFIAIDMNVAKEYITNKNLALNNETQIYFDKKALIIESKNPITTLSKEDNYKYTETASIALESWLGNEMFELINNNNLKHMTYGDCYSSVDIAKEDGLTVHRINRNTAKYIIVEG